MLQTARTSGADLRQMQSAAASYLDDGYRHNQAILEAAARRVRRAVLLLTVEILALATALLVTTLHWDERHTCISQADHIESDAGHSAA